MFSLHIDDLTALVRSRDILTAHQQPCAADITKFLHNCVLNTDDADPPRDSDEEAGIALDLMLTGQARVNGEADGTGVLLPLLNSLLDDDDDVAAADALATVSDPTSVFRYNERFRCVVPILKTLWDETPEDERDQIIWELFRSACEAHMPVAEVRRDTFIYKVSTDDSPITADWMDGYYFIWASAETVGTKQHD